MCAGRPWAQASLGDPLAHIKEPESSSRRSAWAVNSVGVAGAAARGGLLSVSHWPARHHGGAGQQQHEGQPVTLPALQELSLAAAAEEVEGFFPRPSRAGMSPGGGEEEASWFLGSYGSEAAILGSALVLPLAQHPVRQPLMNKASVEVNQYFYKSYPQAATWATHKAALTHHVQVIPARTFQLSHSSICLCPIWISSSLLPSVVLEMRTLHASVLCLGTNYFLPHPS